MLISDKKVPVLIKTIRALQNYNIDYWVCNGTLLGLIRDSCLIPWDHDIDIGVMKGTNRNSIISAFEHEEMIIIDSGNNSDYMTFSYGNVKIDINFFSKIENNLVSLWKVPKNHGFTYFLIKIFTKFQRTIPKNEMFWTLEGYEIPYQYVFPLENRNFYGKEICVPKFPEQVLAYIYGKNWIVPNKNYDWRKDGINNAKK